MRKTLSAIAAGACCILLSPYAAMKAAACGAGIISITNFPSIPDAGFDVFGLNSTGQLTGFYYVGMTQPAQAFLYDGGLLTGLGTLGGMTSSGYAINDAGQIAGQADLADFQTHASLFTGGQVIDLGTLGGSFSTASVINQAGQVIGTSTLQGDIGTAGFFYSSGALNNIGTLGGDCYPFGLNNSGLIVGESALTNGDFHAFEYSGGTLTDLGTLGSNYSAAFAVNDSGLIVGESTTANGDNHGFVYASGVMTDIGTLGGTYSSAYTLNSTGQVVGSSTTLNDQETHAFLYFQGVMTDLGSLGGGYSVPTAINNKGQVIGQSTIANGDGHAFVYSSGRMQDLNSMLPANSGWVLQEAYYINDAGRVAGVGLLNGQSEWFVLDLGAGNSAPVAVAGPDQTVECSAQVTLDGSQSFDPDQDPLSYVWSIGDFVLGTNVTLATGLPLGTNVVTLTVSDPCGASSQTNVTIRVVDTIPPTIQSVPGPITLSANANCQAAVPNVLAGVVATDGCTPANQLVLMQSPAAGTVLGHGQYTITMTATDLSGNSSSAQVPLSIVDTTPPVIQSVSATPNVLSPPNNKMVAVSVSVGATDNCDSTPVSKIVSITSDGTVSAGQIQITGPLTASLAASKNGGGARVYTITVQCTDASGNSSTATTTVTVPQNGNGKK